MRSGRILITGANGFVGHHLIQHLLSEEQEEFADHILASVLPTELEAASAWAQANLTAQEQVRLTWHGKDLSLAGAGKHILQETKPNLICHLAARASGADTDRHAVFQVNVEATRQLLSAAAEQATVPLTLLISTGYAYGNTTIERPAQETDSLSEPGIYGAYTDSKIEMERVAKEFGTKVMIVRSFSHTGPGQTPTFAVPSFARQISRIERGLAASTIRVGNLEALRDMLDVRDVVRAYILLLREGTGGETYNVASGQPHRMQDILNLLRSLSAIETTVEVDPVRVRPADISCSTGDSTKLCDATGWAPRVLFDQTMSDTLNWWREIVE